MFLTKEKNGYYYIYYIHLESGKRTKISTESKNSVKANLFFTKFKRDYELNQLGGIKSISIVEFMKVFISQRKNYVTKNHVLSYENELRQFDKFFNNKLKLNEIRQEHIDSYSNYLFETTYKTDRMKVVKSYKIGTIKKKLATLFTAIRFAKKNKYISKDIDLDMPTISIPYIEKKFLRENELLQLVGNTKNQDLKDVIFVAFMTGMRRGEIANLQWQQIDIEKGYFYLNNTVHLTKNRRIRNIPLTDGVIAIVKNRFIKRTCDYVFTYKKEKWNISTLKRYFVLLTKKTFGKDAGVTFHTLRHSFASNLVAGGISIYEVSKLLGHADIKTTQIYAHLREDTLKEVIKGIDIKREKLFSNN